MNCVWLESLFYRCMERLFNPSQRWSFQYLVFLTRRELPEGWTDVCPSFSPARSPNAPGLVTVGGKGCVDPLRIKCLLSTETGFS